MSDASIRTVEGSMDATGLRVAIVVARFNAFITDRLCDGAVDTLVRSGAQRDDITVVRVPGCFELPQAVARVLTAGDYDAVIALGCLMRGDTLHFELIAGECIKGLSALSQQGEAPVAFGVLTTDTLEQAVHRAGAKHGNKGAEAALAAIEQVGVLRAVTRAHAPAGRSRRGTKKK